MFWSPILSGCSVLTAFYSSSLVFMSFLIESHPNISCVPSCRNDPHPVLPTSKNTGIVAPDMLYCTQDMCPVKIHWHVKVNYQEYWRVKLTITNRDLSRNFSLWNMVAQHPNFRNFTEAFSFSYKPLNPYGPSSSKFLSNS